MRYSSSTSSPPALPQRPPLLHAASCSLQHSCSMRLRSSIEWRWYRARISPPVLADERGDLREEGRSVRLWRRRPPRRTPACPPGRGALHSTSSPPARSYPFRKRREPASRGGGTRVGAGHCPREATLHAPGNGESHSLHPDPKEIRGGNGCERLFRPGLSIHGERRDVAGRQPAEE